MRSKPASLWRAASSVAVASLALGGCEARDPGRTTVLYASGADLQSINPLVAVHPLAKQVQNHVLFLTLAAYDADLTAIPRLASWTWDERRTVLHLDLRRDVTWHDGVPTTAADVVWTLEQARNPAVAYPRAGELRDVVAVTAVDSFSVEVTFATPQPGLPDVLTDLAILPAHRFNDVQSGGIRDAAFNREPVGNGPFAFVEYRPNQRWVFRRFDGFPVALGRPALDRFVVVVVDEPVTKLAGLTSGELDFAGISPAHADFVRRNPRLRVVDYPILLTYGALFNLRRAPFDDARVRRALSRTIDRERIVEVALAGFGTPAAGPVPSDHPWYEPPPAVPYDPEEARTLLDAAGWRLGSDGVRIRNGQPLAFDLLTVGSGDLALEQMLEAAWRAVGARVRIRRAELATFLAVAQSPERDFDVLVMGMPGTLSLGHVAALFDGDGPLAYSGYHAADLSAGFAAVRVARDPAAVEAGWRAVQRALAAGEPAAWLYHARGVQGVARRIAGVRIDLRGELAGIADWRVADTNGEKPR